jgi:hypothetical protein
MSEKSGTNGNFIFYIICSICSPRHYEFSQPLYHVCADIAQHTGIGIYVYCVAVNTTRQFSPDNKYFIHYMFRPLGPSSADISTPILKTLNCIPIWYHISVSL